MTTPVTVAGQRPQLNELGFYALAGAPKSPAELFDEIPAGEALGLGSTFLSERFNIKEAATLSGAVAAVSQNLGIGTAATAQIIGNQMSTGGGRQNVRPRFAVIGDRRKA